MAKLSARGCIVLAKVEATMQFDDSTESDTMPNVTESRSLWAIRSDGKVLNRVANPGGGNRHWVIRGTVKDRANWTEAWLTQFLTKRGYIKIAPVAR